MDHESLDCSNFDGLDVDSLNNNDQLIWIVNSWIIFNKKVECYENYAEQFSKFLLLKRNHEFYKNHIPSGGIWTPAGIGEVMFGIFSSYFS